MKKLVLVGVAGLVAALLGPGPAAHAAPGDLDEMFSRDGLVQDERLLGVASATVQPDGATVVVGRSPDEDFAIARYLPDGSPDPSFGDAGIAAVDFGSRSEASAVALDPEGSIVVAGTVEAAAEQTDMALARVLADGTLDPSFGQNGLVRTDLEGAFDPAPGEVVVAADGRIVAVGGYSAAAVTRYRPNGSLDDSFADDGTAMFELGPDLGSAEGAAVTNDGSILAAGSVGTEPEVDSVLFRVTPDGELDSGFGDGGSVIANLGVTDGWSGLAVQPDGRVVTAGSGCRSFSFGCVDNTVNLARYGRDGRPDPSFGQGGVTQVPTAYSANSDRAFELQPDGKLVVAGRGTYFPQVSSDDFEMLRFNSDGSPDASFGGGLNFDDGAVLTDFALSTDSASAVALAPDGRVVAAGWTCDFREVPGCAPPSSEAALARYEVTDGPPDIDADGVLDDQDRCPTRFAGHDSGCPRIDRSLKLKRKGERRLRGKVNDELGGECLAKRVKVFRVRHGADRRVAKPKPKADGKWTVNERLPRGRYYATVRPSLDPFLGRCSRERSRRVRI